MGVIPVAGLALRNGLLHYRHINALFLAARIKDLTEPTDRVCEFGAGLGLAAFYLNRMGRTDTTFFDIPLTNVLSGYFLIGVLGPDAVSLEGEHPRAGTVKISANWNCVDVPDGHFRLVANQDSFPEINPRALDEYVSQIARCTTDSFLSINHEVEHQIGQTARHRNVSKLLHDDQRFAPSIERRTGSAAATSRSCTASCDTQPFGRSHRYADEAQEVDGPGLRPNRAAGLASAVRRRVGKPGSSGV